MAVRANHQVGGTLRPLRRFDQCLHQFPAQCRVLIGNGRRCPDVMRRVYQVPAKLIPRLPSGSLTVANLAPEQSGKRLFVLPRLSDVGGCAPHDVEVASLADPRLKHPLCATYLVLNVP